MDVCCFFQAEDGIRELVRSRGLGDVYKRQMMGDLHTGVLEQAEPPVMAGDPAAPEVAAIAAAWMFDRQAQAALRSQPHDEGNGQSGWKRSARWRVAP